ncbi:hypothetical protein B0H13DRAFT_2052591 [Mycena leptocephala]|nr:hypothetical protein B0H13DRAFT_2052591 [Mycena leptocephala]
MSSQRTLFVTLAAQAMSSVGFSVSILAWIWLTLIPPPKPELTEPILVDKKARRRSAPAALQSRKRNSLSPTVASQSSGGDAQFSPISPPRTRRVYFIDSPTSSPSRPTNQIERISYDSANLLEKPLHSSPTSEISPASSSSTLVHTYTSIPPQTLETCRESAIESDSSHNSSPRPSLSLSRPFQKTSTRTRRSSGTSVPEIAPIITGPPLDTKQPRRSSGSFIPPWSFRRASGPRNAAGPAATPASGSSSATPASPARPSTAPAPSYFGRKTARRTSTPVPRTQPYAYPYYAQPPIEDEGYVAYLRNLPQFSTDALVRGPTTSDSEEKEKEKEKDSPLLDQRGRNRKVNDKAQAALGLGRRPTPKRSASEGWGAGKDARL